MAAAGVVRKSATIAAMMFVAAVCELALRFVCTPTGIKPTMATRQNPATPRARTISTRENAAAFWSARTCPRFSKRSRSRGIAALQKTRHISPPVRPYKTDSVIAAFSASPFAEGERIEVRGSPTFAAQPAKPSPCPLSSKGRGESVPLTTYRRGAESLPFAERKVSFLAVSFRTLMADRPGLRRS